MAIVQKHLLAPLSMATPSLIHASDGPQAMERVARYYHQVLARYSNHQKANQQSAKHQSANQLFSDQEIEQLVYDTKAKKTAIIVRPEKVCIWGHSDRCGVY